MIDIYDKSLEKQYTRGDDTDLDANACCLTFSMLTVLWQSLVGEAETSGQIDWAGVKIKPHPCQLAAIEAQKLNTAEDVFEVFKNFQGNVKWTVDNKIRRDALEMKVNGNTGTWARLFC